MERKILSLILAVLLAMGCAGCGALDSSAREPEPEMEAAQETETPEPTLAPEAREVVAMPLEDLITVIKAELSEKYSYYDTCVEDNKIIASAWVKGLSSSLLASIREGPSENQAVWDDMKEEMVSLANVLQGYVEHAGHGGMSVTLQLLNYTHKEEAFIVISNGEIIYDVIEDSESNAANNVSFQMEQENASAMPTPTPEPMVWIPQSGTKYHSRSSCSNMDNPSQVSLSTAQAWGYTACKKCY